MHDTYNRETIAAVITPPGEGGIGAIRIAGNGSHRVLSKIFRPAHAYKGELQKFRLYYGHIVDNDNHVVDEVTAVLMPEGESYTGQDQAEIFCHGGQVVLRKILNLIFMHEVRPAEPGEFTRRAFLSGRIDLARAEAVAELIAAKTDYSYSSAKKNLLGEMSDYINELREKAVQLMAEVEASVDYPEEDIAPEEYKALVKLIDSVIEKTDHLRETYRGGQIIREGFKIAIAGRPNAGKSSLFNLMLNHSRAIVAPTPGTTRDYLTEWIDLEGIAVSLTDTAGLRKKSGKIEQAGQQAAQNIMEQSDLIIWISDISRKGWKKEMSEDLKDFPFKDKLLIINNKTDLVKQPKGLDIAPEKVTAEVFPLSCKTKTGFDRLKKGLLKRITSEMPDMTDRLVVTSERHKQKLDQAADSFRRVRDLIAKNETPEIVAFELRTGIDAIDEITGRIYNEEILDRIFARFCIGK